MEYKFTAYNAFVRYSDSNTLPQRDYNAFSTASRKAGKSQVNKAKQAAPAPATEKVTLSNPNDRKAMINKIKSQFKIGGANPLMGSLVPTGGLGMGTGLYSGVGQLPSYKVKSLISQYV